MRRKIIAYNHVSTEILHRLADIYDLEFFNHTHTYKDPIFLRALQQTEGIIGLELKVDKELLNHAPLLKIISNVSTGYSNLDIEEMTKHRVMATNTPGVLEETTADAIFGILLAAARRIPEFDHYVKAGHWRQFLKEEQFGTNVHHKTLGIIGMGRIGSQIAKRGHLGFDMNILYFNRSRNKEAEEKYHATYCDLETLLKESDFVCLMTPLTAETENLIGEREFKLMKRSCIFVNGSRGKTINENDLINALKNKVIRGAALDVYQTEPINSDNFLLQFPNVVTTPHIGSSTYETELKMSALAAENLIDGLSGKCPKNLINRDVFINKIR